MKTCDGCKYAEWRKTSNGRLHPSGDGMCAYPWTLPKLPASMYFVGGEPRPSGGVIRRKEEHKDHCPYWNPANGELTGTERAGEKP